MNLPAPVARLIRAFSGAPKASSLSPDSPKAVDVESAEYCSQGALSLFEADRILPQLKEAKIRFRLDADPSSHGRYGGDARIALFVHSDDLDAWNKIRAEHFPI
jgi:hypothetical protein